MTQTLQTRKRKPQKREAEQLEAVTKMVEGWRNPEKLEAVTKMVEGWRSPDADYQPTHAGRE